MNAVRPDEELDNIHSIYVDQWDWEKVITSDQRNFNFLKDMVTRIYQIMKRTEFYVYELYPDIEPILPEKIKFIHAEGFRGSGTGSGTSMVPGHSILLMSRNLK